MAKFCDMECEEIGSICDFCKFYEDDLKFIDGKFAGEGMCSQKNIKVDACDGADCEEFECIRVGGD